MTRERETGRPEETIANNWNTLSESLLSSTHCRSVFFRWFVLGKNPSAYSIVSIYDALGRGQCEVQTQTKKTNLCPFIREVRVQQSACIACILPSPLSSRSIDGVMAKAERIQWVAVLFIAFCLCLFLRQRRKFIIPTTHSHNHCASLFALNLFVTHTEPYEAAIWYVVLKNSCVPFPRDETERPTSRLAGLAGWLTNWLAHSEVCPPFLFFFLLLCGHEWKGKVEVRSRLFVDLTGRDQWAPFPLCMRLLLLHEWIRRMFP